MKTIFIIPAYKDADYLEGCVKSIQAQTAADQIEDIILVENGSRELEAQAISLGIKYTHSKVKNRASARNHALQLPSNYYYAFIDVDVVLSPQWLEHMLAELSPCTVATGSTTHVGGSKLLNEIRGLIYNRRINSRLPSLNSSNLIIDGNTFHKVQGFKEVYKRAEDTFLTLELSRNLSEITKNPNAKCAVHCNHSFLSFIIPRAFSSAFHFGKMVKSNNLFTMARMSFIELLLSEIKRKSSTSWAAHIFYVWIFLLEYVAFKLARAEQKFKLDRLHSSYIPIVINDKIYILNKYWCALKVGSKPSCLFNYKYGVKLSINSEGLADAVNKLMDRKSNNNTNSLQMGPDQMDQLIKAKVLMTP
ncbi:MAG: glycosyltransferase family 2 protein [Bacteriovoracaceae bacterium]|nr:glycosyltransferase family 2 protein [Bacteriovoracaceae bacterium]